MKIALQIVRSPQQPAQREGGTRPRWIEPMRSRQRERRAAARRHIVDQEERLNAGKPMRRIGRYVHMPVQAVQGSIALVRRRQQQLRALAGRQCLMAQSGYEFDAHMTFRTLHTGCPVLIPDDIQITKAPIRKAA